MPISFSVVCHCLYMSPIPIDGDKTMALVMAHHNPHSATSPVHLEPFHCSPSYDIFNAHYTAPCSFASHYSFPGPRSINLPFSTSNSLLISHQITHSTQNNNTNSQNFSAQTKSHIPNIIKKSERCLQPNRSSRLLPSLSSALSTAT